ncbi:response regulator [Microscilla marina]|uniref:Response regulator receiver domain protein, putative n=1 Tax=Microscilla marina ATCC 23134 TaxID=313606 RepID=A1ZQY9_MICM2|nr:response regulator [Microscilla marina]EAY27294.1 response regulator receiver domain protein, putative [Microscilla marina ATCC 23134]
MTDYHHILIIDDDKTFIKVNHKIFSTITGCNNVNFKMSGTTALEFLAEMDKAAQFPDLITLDWRMSLGNGADFLKAYEQKYYANHPNTKILIITEASQEVAPSHQSLDFVSGVLAKPLRANQLKEVL